MKHVNNDEEKIKGTKNINKKDTKNPKNDDGKLKKDTAIKKKKGKINTFLNKKTDFKVYELILFAVLIMIISVFLTVVVMTEISKTSVNKIKNKINGDYYITEFEEVYDLINSSYYKDVNKKELTEGAINGMLNSLDDPHTSYFNKLETDNFNEVMNGSYKGIGVEITLDTEGNIIVFMVFKNSPAYDAGLKFNDKIISINGKSTDKMNTTEVASIIKDDSVNTVSMKVKRGDSILEFEMEKKVIEIESVESNIYDVNDKKIGYVLINTFANNTYEQFRKNVEKLEKQNISGLVIDVRGNSGGYLHSVTSMLDMFLPKGTICYQISDKKTTYKYAATTDESRNYPVAVLVNKASASGSEVLAISLKESYGAIVVGTNTYGKGTVQTTKNLSSGGMIKYTIQKWLSPKGNWVNGIGLEPTIKQEQSSEYEQNPTFENDIQLKKALEAVSNK